MNENIENLQNKDCFVCNNISNNENINIELKNIISKYIIEGYKYDELVSLYNSIKDRYNDNLILPNKYYLEKHQQECLSLDLKTLRENRKLQLELSKKDNFNKKNKENKIVFQQEIDMTSKLVEYRNKSLQECEVDYLNILREIYYMSLLSIHHQLEHGKYSVSIIPKEDISALKNIYDIIKNVSIEETNNSDDTSDMKNMVEKFIEWERKQ